MATMPAEVQELFKEVDNVVFSTASLVSLFRRCYGAR